MAEESPRTKVRKEIETAKEIQALETELAQIRQATSALQQSAPNATPAAAAAAPSTEPAASSSASTPAVVQTAPQQPATDDGRPSVNAAILGARGHDGASAGAGGAPLDDEPPAAKKLRASSSSRASSEVRDERLMPFVPRGSLPVPFNGTWVLGGDGKALRVYGVTFDESDHVWASRSPETEESETQELEDFGEYCELTDRMAKWFKATSSVQVNAKASLVNALLRGLSANGPWTGKSMGIMAQPAKPITQTLISKMKQRCDRTNLTTSFFPAVASVAFKFMLRGAEKTEAGELIEVDDGNGGVVLRLPLIDPAELCYDGNDSLETTGGGSVPPKAPTWEGTVPETAKATHARVKARAALLLKKVEEATKAKDASLLPGRNFPKITSDDYEEIKKNAWTKLELKHAAEAAAKNDASIWQPAIDMKEEAWKSAGELKKQIHKHWRQPTSVTIKSETEKKIRAAHAELSR